MKRYMTVVLLSCFLFAQGCVSLILLGVAAKKRSDRRKTAQAEKPAEVQSAVLIQEEKK